MSPRPPQIPDHTPRAADRLLPAFGAVSAAALCVFLLAPGDAPAGRVLEQGLAVFGGWLVGLLSPRLYRHRFRVLGFVPYLTTAAALLAAVVQLAFDWCPWSAGGFMLAEGAACGAVLRYRDRFREAPSRFLLAAAGGLVVGAAVVAAYTEVGHTAVDWTAGYRWALLALAAGLAAAAWGTLFRPAVELTLEPAVRFAYRLSAAGPGAAAVPLTGPCLVIANHASWFDPLLLALVLPRPITAMMTAGFYDLPVLRWLMPRVFRTIRVAEQAVRRDAPEIAEAVEALDAGRCVVVFPEGYLRRRDDQPLRRFGQGVWQILKARPDTPVVACWIEGVWGSYFSHFNGPPTRNKPRDVRRPVAVGVSAPAAVLPDVLAGNLATRVYLMNAVLAARAHLGLPDLPPVSLPGQDDAQAADGAE